MREIIFRGFNTENQKWYYGLLGKIKGKYFITSKGCALHYVKKNSVGQFTGAFDITGKKIYEGDIVQIEEKGFDKEKGLVVFAMGEWGIETPIKRRPDDKFHIFTLYYLSTKVVGNIYKMGGKK